MDYLGRLPIPGSAQVQIGWSFEKPGPTEGVLAHGRRVGTKYYGPFGPNHFVIPLALLRNYCLLNTGRVGLLVPCLCSALPVWLLALWQSHCCEVQQVISR